MGAEKKATSRYLENPSHPIDQFFDDAFGPRPALFRITSLCGWYPIINMPCPGARWKPPIGVSCGLNPAMAAGNKINSGNHGNRHDKGK